MLLLRDLPTDGELAAMHVRYPELEPETVAALLAMLRAATDAFQRAESYFTPRNLSCGRFAVLALLNRDPEASLTPSQIAESCGVTRATITGLLDGLEQDGHIRRERDDGDRRTQQVRLTDSGRRFLDGMMPEHYQRMNQLMSGLDERDRRHLRRICQKISATAQALAQPPQPASPS